MGKQGHRRRAAVRIGVSGWTYSPWRGQFYPKGLTQKNELGFAARQFPALEINGTFYGLQKPDAFARWAEATPDGFVFAVKGSRFITHIRRLREIEKPLANFLASGLLLWFGERDTRFRWASTVTLHDGLLYASLFLLVGHLYLAVIHPATRHSLRGMTTGKVREDWARRHYPRWFEGG